MANVDLILLILVLAAGLYMAWNIGANDVANAIGTSVGSGALKLSTAVLIAAVFEFSGAFFFGSHVTDMVQEGIVNPEVFTNDPRIFVFGMLSALIAAGVWLQFASYFGWPVSTTHSIVGSIVGFGAIVGGVSSVYWDNVIYITFGWILSPLIGGFISYFIFTILRRRIFYAPCPVVAAKNLTPKIVFVFASTLGTALTFNGLKNLDLDLTFTESLFGGMGFGLLASIVSYFFINQIQTPPGELKKEPDYSPEAILSLNKVRKHLKKVRKETKGETAYRVSQLLDRVEELSHETSKHERVGSVDYASVEKIFARLQVMSACSMAFAHGANDVANAIGPLSAAVSVILSGTVASTSTPIPTWTLALGGIGIILGLVTWGWRVIETIGKKITELTPSRGFSAEFGAALTIVFASRLGLPISTTHTLVGSVLGVGLARGIEALNLNTTRDIVISWIITVPAGALISIVCFYILDGIF
ncbi:MAG: inorganic phosphate transporter [Chlamydiota bacterium]|nr:inorganic phosphate transporter [Chlamydiota bacterium]